MTSCMHDFMITSTRQSLTVNSWSFVAISRQVTSNPRRRRILPDARIANFHREFAATRDDRLDSDSQRIRGTCRSRPRQIEVFPRVVVYYRTNDKTVTTWVWKAEAKKRLARKRPGYEASSRHDSARRGPGYEALRAS